MITWPKWLTLWDSVFSSVERRLGNIKANALSRVLNIVSAYSNCLINVGSMMMMMKLIVQKGNRIGPGFSR